MSKNIIQNMTVDELVSSDAGQKIRQILETASNVQRGLYALAVSEDDAKLNLLKIGTVFQLFFIDTLAAGKQPGDLTKEDWISIANRVNRYAVLEEGQRYSEFVFSLYADYIDLSAETMRGSKSGHSLLSIKELANAIRKNAEDLRNEEINEASYIESCLWLSLEAMIKLLCCYFTLNISEEYADLLQSVSQLAFEYGRYVLFSKEQALLEKYIENQYVLDEQLQTEYEAYLEEVKGQADAFQKLIDNAFSPNISEALHNSAVLARAAGVREEEILTSVEEIDSFLMD